MTSAAAAAEEQLIADVAAFSDDPLGYVRYAFPWGEQGELFSSDGPRAWQVDILDGIGKHLRSPDWSKVLRVAVASGKGIGKSALIAMITQWGMSTCDDCRIIITANTGQQLANRTAPEVRKWFRRSINAHWWDVAATRITIKDKAHAPTWRLDFETWSKEKTEAFAGLHNVKKRIIIVFDEGSAIPDEVWEEAESTLTDPDTEMIFIVFGNPTRTSGRFRRCFGDLAHRWQIHKQIDSRTVEGTNREEIAQWIEDFGEDSDYVRVKVRGEFPRASADQFIATDVVAAARKRNVGDQSKAWKILSVDVARKGDDQSVIGYRQGLLAKILAKHRGIDTQELGARVVQTIKAENPRACVIDGDGVGGGVYDYVEHHLADWMKAHPAFTLVEFHGGSTPIDSYMYYNKRAECWGLMRDWLVTGQIPNDPELETDLTGPEYFHSNKDQIQLEKKDDMRSRGVASPDCGDMLAMTFGVTPTPKTRDEALAESIAAMEKQDPTEAHFMRMRETERRKQANKPLGYWE